MPIDITNFNIYNKIFNNSVIKITLLLIVLNSLYSCKNKYEEKLKKSINDILTSQRNDKCLKVLKFKDVFNFEWQECYCFISNTDISTINENIQAHNQEVINKVPDNTYKLIFLKDSLVVYQINLSTHDFTIFSKIKVTPENGLFFVDKKIHYNNRGYYYYLFYNDGTKSYIDNKLSEDGYQELCK